ncbi:islet cell autoantigen 1-like isoform X2 [Silurus meridionalis]|uniref:islet cell autoantigen 1-like isoform X2 n=1 Tax=Silurus meridionalis TaxID=175797 RepID=UPI001EEAECD6|nr:islet cell autoantigen 1-like isoform X2 [Silurus meridionalis]
MDGYGFSSPILGEDRSVMARMQKKFWKTKQVLIKATGKKEDEHVVASDADLDAKLEFFRSIQSTCTELLKVIEKYQQRITRLSQEENELGLFLRFQAEHDKTKAGSMMNATSKALCTSAKQRLALCAPLQRMEQEMETFRRRAIADTLLTMSRMEKSRTEYRGALLWMKDVSQELDPDTYKQLEKFRKVQAQVRGTKMQFDKLKNDVCQKVDMLGASRCNLLSHSLCTYQTTLLQFWEKTANIMSGIHEAFQGYVPYNFTTLKDLRDPLEHLLDSSSLEDKKDKGKQTNADKLVSLEEEKTGTSAFEAASLDSVTSDLLSGLVPYSGLEEEEGERGDLSFLQDLLSPGASSGTDDFSKAWQDAFGCFEAPVSVPCSTDGAAAPASNTVTRSPSQPPSPTGFLPSQLLDHGISTTGWMTPPMFQTPPLQATPTAGQVPAAQNNPRMSDKAPQGGGARDMSAWFNLFADLDPLSNPDAIGRSDEDLLNA